jgi:hypothetical protein
VKDIFNIAPILLLPLGGWRNLVGVFLFNTMKIFLVKSPSGKILPTWAETIYHAIQKAMVVDGFNYNQIEYNKLNTAKK